jgi:endonuclease YncB( thermonuclease family)
VVALATDMKCRYLGAPSSEKPGFALSARARAIVAEKGKGTLQLTIAGKTENAGIRFTVQGCDVDSIKDETSPAVYTRDGDGWKVTANTMLTLQLSNLSPTVPVLVIGTDTSNKATTDPISLQVLVQPEPCLKPAGP